MQSLFFLITTMLQMGINKQITFNKHFARKYIRAYTTTLIQHLLNVPWSGGGMSAYLIASSVGQKDTSYYQEVIAIYTHHQSASTMFTFIMYIQIPTRQKKYLISF